MPRSDRSAQITLRALVSARWVLLGLIAAAELLSILLPARLEPWLAWFPQSPEPVGVFVILAAWLLANVLTEHRFLRTGRATRAVAGAHLLVDAVVLTVLLALSGGPTNPFTTVYFVPITLATQVSPRWTWTLAGVCVAGFASLFVLHPLPPAMPGHGDHFAGHLRGMWIAFGVSGGLVTLFVHRIAMSLAQQRDELARLSEQVMKERHFAALGTLAAGAAHELGTPLGTIQLLAGELPHMSEPEREQAVSSMRQQVSRCKDIVHRMASPEPDVRSFGPDGGLPWALSALGERARERATHSGISLQVSLDSDVQLRQPREPIEQIVRELIANAVDACTGYKDGTAGITLRLGQRGHDALIEVRDDGVGMEPEVAAHAFEPFYSTKAEGEGMGMGLYLARAQVRRLGGQLELDSAPGHGTTLRMTLPPLPPSRTSV